MNLVNITAGGGYNPTSAVNTLAIVESFLNNLGGSTDITLQIAGYISNVIVNSNPIVSTYSGSATPVPEPGTIALLGISLAGLVGVGVRKRAMKKAV